jgi:hypothetical protein
VRTQPFASTMSSSPNLGLRDRSWLCGKIRLYRSNVFLRFAYSEERFEHVHELSELREQKRELGTALSLVRSFI